MITEKQGHLHRHAQVVLEKLEPGVKLGATKDAFKKKLKLLCETKSYKIRVTHLKNKQSTPIFTGYT